jgi:hypothetical protein
MAVLVSVGVGVFCTLAPLLRGEGRGEGLLPLGQDTRIAQLRDPTSPRKRGEVKMALTP